jgi:hypothetical protein
MRRFALSVTFLRPNDAPLHLGGYWSVVFRVFFGLRVLRPETSVSRAHLLPV